MKRYSTLLFFVEEQGLETRKLRKLLAKEEEEVQRDSRLVKECMRLLERLDKKCKTKPCFYRLFMSGQEGHSEEL